MSTLKIKKIDPRTFTVRQGYHLHLEGRICEPGSVVTVATEDDLNHINSQRWKVVETIPAVPQEAGNGEHPVEEAASPLATTAAKSLVAEQTGPTIRRNRRSRRK